MIQGRLPAPPPRSPWIDGNAVTTTRASSVISRQAPAVSRTVSLPWGSARDRRCPLSCVRPGVAGVRKCRREVRRELGGRRPPSSGLRRRLPLEPPLSVVCERVEERRGGHMETDLPADLLSLA